MYTRHTNAIVTVFVVVFLILILEKLLEIEKNSIV